MQIHYGKVIKLRYPAKDSTTKEPLYPGDTVKVYPAYYYWKTIIKDDGTEKKLFYSRFELVKRTAPVRKVIAKTVASMMK